jgi:serine/threonine protein kinase
MVASTDDPEQGPLPRACGAYTLKKVLGAGGMAIVYRAEHTLLGQEVAIKMIRPAYADEPAVVALFGSELQALARIRHPNVVEVQNVFESEHGEKCLVMELLEAPTLRHMLQRHEPLLLPDLLHLAVQVAQALHAAHAAGVIHRDLKPDNVAVLHRPGFDEQRLFAKVLDFGVARLAPLAGAEGEGKEREQIVGTLAYIAPELLRGEAASARSDAYAFGVLIYELVSGQLPFDPRSASQLTSERPTLLPLAQLRPDLPVEILELVTSCIALEPGARPASMQEVINVLERLRTRQQAYVHTSWYADTRRPILPALLWIAVALVTVGLAWLWQSRRPPDAVVVPPAAAAVAPPVPPRKTARSKPRKVSAPSRAAEAPRPTASPRTNAPKPPPLPAQNLDESEPLDDDGGEDVPEVQ